MAASEPEPDFVIVAALHERLALDASEIELLDPELEADPVLKTYVLAMKAAAVCANKNLRERCKDIGPLLEKIKDLLREIRKETRGFHDMASRIDDAAQTFASLVQDTKSVMILTKTHLGRMEKRLAMTQEAFSHDQMTSDDFQDVTNSSLLISKWVGEFKGTMESRRTEFKKNETEVDLRVKEVRDKKQTLLLRQNRILNFSSFVTGGVTGGLIATGLVSAEIFGGAGALIVAGTTFPPLGAILGLAVAGGLAAAGICALVQHFVIKHNKRAMEYLDQLLVLLQFLKQAHNDFITYVDDSIQIAVDLSSKTDELGLSKLTRRQRALAAENLKGVVGSIASMQASIDMACAFQPESPCLQGSAAARKVE